MKSQTCCFTGHRSIPEWDRDTLSVRLRETIRSCILSGYRYFGAGGALGFDTMAAQAVLSLKTEFPHIRLILVLPCKDQADRWSDADKTVYEAVKNRADKIVYIAEHYIRDCMFRRNRHLVDHSSLCICYLRKTSGGTSYTVNYAKAKGISVKNLAPSI